MKKIIHIILLILLGSLFVSCSCMRVLNGIVKDSETHKPIVGATVSVMNENNRRDFKSNEAGKFSAYLHGGNKCPRIEANIRAEGFEAVHVKEPKKSDTIVVYLKRTERQFEKQNEL